MSQLITLTTDLGKSDYFVALMKGELYQALGSDISLCDISHQVSPHDIQQAAFYMEVSFRKFPEGTIHVAKVSSYYAKENEVICFEREGHYFIGPNNGIFSLLFPDLTEEEVYSVKLEGAKINKLIGHACGCIANGLFPGEMGPHPARVNKKLALKAVITDKNIRATVIHVDTFKNVILNVTKEKFESVRKGRRFEIYYQQHDPITRISKHYNEVPVGDVLCIFNSANLLEISMNMGEASSSLSLNKGEAIQIYFYDDA
jgi:S-adenosylmethionine hydrolase